ncbi:MAG: hypothetical protein ACE5I1_33140, partial [bacterium]
NQKFRTAKDVIDATLTRFENAQKNATMADGLNIWGGLFRDENNNFASFIGKWEKHNGQFDWALWEAVSRFDLVELKDDSNFLPPETEDFNDIERVRIFGEKGDLLVRRDGLDLYWRFIGEKGEMWPEFDAEPFKPKKYDESESPDGDKFSDYSFFQEDVKYLLWNKYLDANKKKSEQRVSTHWRDSKYAQLGDGEMYLHQRHYLRGGRIEFVRYLAIGDEKWQPGK